MKKLLLICFLIWSLTGFSKDLSISNIQVSNINVAAQTATVQFNISWDLSWRQINGNWDAAWVFLKVRLPNGSWRHLPLIDSGHSVPTAGAWERGLANPCNPYNPTFNPVVGMFIYRSQPGSGTFSLNNVSLVFNFGNLPPGLLSDTTVRVHGLEMVYVNRGSFYLGSGGAETNRFHANFNNALPYFVDNEDPILVNSGPTSLNYATNTTNAGDRMGPIPAAFPKGFEAFYIMKYHVSQQEYVNFLNALTPAQQNARTPISVFAPAGTYLFNMNRHKIKIGTPSQNGLPAVYETDYPYVPVSFLNWPDLAAFLDWSGLRPMTELEFEKAGRGPLTPVANEYAWGTAAIRGTLATANGYQLIDPGLISESALIVGLGQTGTGVVGECIYRGTASTSFSSNPFDGPGRIGIFEKEGSREVQGKSFYGVSEMSGQLWDRAVTVGRPNGRNFTGAHGDGLIAANGTHNVNGWPSDAGIGFRGGAYGSIEMHQRLSDRLSAAADFPNRASGNGGRGVRSAPTEMIPAFTKTMLHASVDSISYSFDASSSIGVSSFQWFFGDGNSGNGANVNHTYLTNGTMIVMLVVSNACFTDTLYDTIVTSGIIPPCLNLLNVDFSFVKNGLSVQFNDSSIIQGAATYQWNFGDGNSSASQNPLHTYSIQGTYNVCLIVTDSCNTDTLCKQITICTGPKLQITWASAGPGLIQFFTNWPANATFQWNFGGGNSSSAPSPVQFFTTGAHLVCLIANDGCQSDTVCVTVPVCGLPALDIIATPAGPNLIQFTSNWPNATSYNWDFGNGNTSTSASPIQFFFPGNYNVCLTAIHPDCGTQTHCITANPCPRPPLTFAHVQVAPLTIAFSPSTTTANSYAWDLGDGRVSSVISPTLPYSQAGTYYVCLTIQDDCGTETYCDSILVQDVSLHEVNSLEFNMYPNPANHSVTLEWSRQQNLNYQITNQMGQIVSEGALMRNDSGHLSVGHLPVGIYFLQLSDGLRSGIEKLVIQR